jgi:hypothetical protein
MLIILSNEGIRRFLYLISFILFRNEREHYSSCSNAAVDYANSATRFILRFIEF